MDMTDSLLNTAFEVFPRMLEDTAFLFSEEPTKPQRFALAATGTGIAYEGVESGELRIWAQTPFMLALAANMLGVEETHPSALAKGVDALGELLNIVLGHCLTERFGDAEAMRMGLPRLLDPAILDDDLETGGWLLVEGQPVLIVWKERQ